MQNTVPFGQLMGISLANVVETLDNNQSAADYTNLILKYMGDIGKAGDNAEFLSSQEVMVEKFNLVGYTDHHDCLNLFR